MNKYNLEVAGCDSFYIHNKNNDGHYLLITGELLDWDTCVKLYPNTEKRNKLLYFSTREEAEKYLDNYMNLEEQRTQCVKNIESLKKNLEEIDKKIKKQNYKHGDVFRNNCPSVKNKLRILIKQINSTWIIQDFEGFPIEQGTLEDCTDYIYSRSDGRNKNGDVYEYVGNLFNIL